MLKEERIIAPTFLDQRTKTKCQNRPPSPEEKDFASRSREAETRGVHEVTPCTVEGNREEERRGAKRKRKEREEKRRKEAGYYAFPGARYIQQVDNDVLVHVYRRYIFI